jgi:hypothetical protein
MVCHARILLEIPRTFVFIVLDLAIIRLQLTKSVKWTHCKFKYAPIRTGLILMLSLNTSASVIALGLDRCVSEYSENPAPYPVILRSVRNVTCKPRISLPDRQQALSLIAFGGVAVLAGGSFDPGDRARDDGTYWAAGVSGRYAIQSKTGVDLRLDIVTTSESEQSVYLSLNQAF